MASITPQNGRVSFVADWDPSTYWELNSTNLGTNYGDDPTGNATNVNVTSGDISTSGSYEGMNNQNDPPQSGWFDIYTVTDAAALVYLPSGLTVGNVYGLFHNGGGTNAQSGMVRSTATGIEVVIVHNTGGTTQDNMMYEIPTADLDGWHCLSWQFSSEGGAQGDMALWVDGVKVVDGTRAYQLAYGSGDPDFGASGGDEPLLAYGISPYGVDADWSAAAAITGSGILIANFAVDNPGPTNTTPAGNGDSWHEDYYTVHGVGLTKVVNFLLQPSIDPASSNHKIKVRLKGSSSGTAVVKLLETSTQRATFSPSVTTSWVEYSYTLSTVEADAITSYLDLHVTIEESPLSETGWLQVSWIEMELFGSTSFIEGVIDPVGVTDTTTQETAFVRTIADGVGVTDATSRLYDAARTVVDDVGVIDDTATISETTRTIVDDVGVTDSTVRVADTIRTVTDPTNVTDVLSENEGNREAVVDPVGITDTVTTAIKVPAVTITDTVGVTDTTSEGVDVDTGGWGMIPI